MFVRSMHSPLAVAPADQFPTISSNQIRWPSTFGTVKAPRFLRANWCPVTTSVHGIVAGNAGPGVDRGSGQWSCDEGGVVWEVENLARAADGELVYRGKAGSVCTDSRKIREGQWFLALVGPKFDGHDFLQQALERGCAGVVGQYVPARWPRGFVRVDCSLRALQLLAAHVRKVYRGPVVGITGSTGKTTARAMTSLVLRSMGLVHSTVGNLNNHIGVPLTLLKLPSAASACVLEMGMSAAGEIQLLADIAVPSVRVLLNVGPAHMELFDSLEDVATAKGELLSSARPGDVCVLNADDPLVLDLRLPPNVEVAFFGTQDGCQTRLVEVRPTRGGQCLSVVVEVLSRGSYPIQSTLSGHQALRNLRQELELGRHEQVTKLQFEIPSAGRHLGVNACAALSVAVILGVPLDSVGKSFANFCPVPSRYEMEQVGDIMIVNDAYNSNPMSLESSLSSLAMAESSGRKVVFLGDMFELGAYSEAAHKDAILLCMKLNIGFVGVVGSHFKAATSSLNVSSDLCVSYQSSQELASVVGTLLKPGDNILVKGSRGTRMEVVLDAIKSSQVHVVRHIP